MSAVEGYREAREGSFYKVTVLTITMKADAAIAELEAEVINLHSLGGAPIFSMAMGKRVEQAEAERDEAMATMYHERGDKGQAEAELAKYRQDFTNTDELWEDEAHGLDNQIAILKAENERLKCCGNCAESHDVDNDFMCECWPDINEAKSEDDKPTDVCPGDPCHYTPSRWTERTP